MKQKTICLALAILMAFSLSGCKDKVKAYREEMNVIITEVQNMDSEISGAVTALQTAIQNKDEEAYETNLAELQKLGDSLKEKYTALANVKAPSEYEEEQKQLQQYAEDMGKMLDASMQLYEIAYDYNVNGDVSEDTVQKVTDLQQEISSYQESTTSFDEVLNKVMGYSDSSQS